MCIYTRSIYLYIKIYLYKYLNIYVYLFYYTYGSYVPLTLLSNGNSLSLLKYLYGYNIKVAPKSTIPQRQSIADR